MKIFYTLLAFTSVFLVCALGTSTSARAENEGVLLRETLATLLEPVGENAAELADKKRLALARSLRLAPELATAAGFQKLIREAGLEEITGAAKIGTISPVESLEIIRGHIKDIYEKMAPHLGIEKPHDFDSLARQLAARANQLPEEDILALLKFFPDEPLRASERAVNSLFTNLQFSDLPSLERLKKSVRDMKIRGTSAKDTKDLAETLGQYFDHLPGPRKRAIARAWLRLPPHGSEVQQLAAAVEGAGPGAQKLFQLLAGEAKDPLVKALLSELQTNVKPFSSAEAMTVLEKNLGQPIGEVFSEIEDVPFAAGTVGQVHKARLRSGEWVAVKIQRPGIKTRLREDFESLRRSAKKYPAAEKLLKQMLAHFEREMDVFQEAENLDRMARYRDRSLGIDVPRRASKLPLMPDVLVMDLVDGKPIFKVKNADPRLRADALMQAIDRWYEEAIFESGFFHADFHPGNLLYRETPGVGPGFMATFVDSGSIGDLTLEQRRLLVQFSIAVTTRSPKQSMRILEEMGEIPTEKRSRLKRKITSILMSPKASVFERTNAILLAATKDGVELDSNLLLMGRSMEFLEQQVREANAAVLAMYPNEGTYSLLRTFALKNLGRAGHEIPRQLMDPAFRDVATIETKVIPQAFSGVADGLNTWFRSRRVMKLPSKVTRGCARQFGLL